MHIPSVSLQSYPMRFIAFFLLIFSLTLSADAQEPTPASNSAPSDAPEVSFAKGLDAFQKNDFENARKAFRESVIKDPERAVVWYNLGLAEQRLGRNGVAMAFWRKALHLRHGFQPAERAIVWTRPKLEKADIPHDVEMWENLRNSTLVKATTYQFELLAAILFFITAWFALAYVGRRRRAILDEKPLPSFPLTALISGVLFATLLALTICKIIDDQDLRATVIAKKVEAKALPDASSTTLFELYEGLEVIVRQSRPGWVQVTFPGGATGWIARGALFTNSDRLAL